MTAQLPPLDPREYRRTIGLFATGVTVILTGSDGDIRGMTANSVTSLSLDPLLILFCVEKQAHFATVLQQQRGFTINILGRDQEALSNYFAGFWKADTPPPQFNFVPWHGSARLQDCMAAIGCEIDQFLEGGDHWIVIGRVIALHKPDDLPDDPLIFFRGQYRGLTQP